MTDRIRLGNSGLEVSPFCVGRVDSEDTITAAFDAGINFFFVSADMHWPLYEKTRQGIEKLLRRGRGIRDRIVVGVVSYPTQPEFCTRPFEELCQSMPCLRRVDVAIAGGAYANEIANRVPIYRRHRRERFLGTRAIGASFHDRAGAAQAANSGLFDIVFIRYNPGHPGARSDFFPSLAARRRTRIFNFKSTLGHVGRARLRELGLGADHWYPRVTDYYRFALTPAAMDGVLCAPRTPREVEALAEALEEGPLDTDEENYLLTLAELDRGTVVLRRRA